MNIWASIETQILISQMKGLSLSVTGDGDLKVFESGILKRPSLSHVESVMTLWKTEIFNKIFN